MRGRGEDHQDWGQRRTAFETYTTGDKDFSAQLTKIVAANPDVLFLPNYYSEVPLQVQQALRVGYKGKFLGSDSWGSTELVKLGGADMEVERAAYRPLRNAPRVSAVITALGIGLFLENFTLAVLGAEPRKMPVLIPATNLRIGGATVSTVQLEGDGDA